MSDSMSSLQVSLAVIGGLTLVAVAAYNYWTSRKNSPRQAEPNRNFTPQALEPRLDMSRSARCANPLSRS